MVAPYSSYTINRGINIILRTRTQAILAKAFRGELAPTEAELARQEGRDCEPASVLLERIRAVRADDETNGTKRRTYRQSREEYDG